MKKNIGGLLRFIWLLFRTFILPKLMKKHQKLMKEPVKEQGKYDALIGPSLPLVPTEMIFCPKCHVPVAQIRRTTEGTQIIKQGKVLIAVGGNITITKDDKETRGVPIRCTNGHTVWIK